MNETNSSGGFGLTGLFVVLLLSGVALLVLGAYLAVTERQFEVLAIGLLAIIVTAGRGGGGGGAVPDHAIHQQVRILQTIADRMLLSDQAKRIAYREKDREALRQAILEDIRKEDYDAALALVNDMVGLYGYREEAEKYRQQILDTQSRRRQAMIGSAVAQIDVMLERRDWEAARRDVDRLKRLYPEDPQVSDLPQRIRQALDKYKLNLVSDFREAFDRQDIDRASTLLAEMDRMLTPDEARPHVDLARQVLAQKRENMGVQFKMAVQDRDWGRAVAIGEQIIREFPNTGFAAEVREMLNTLRDRAAAQRTAV